MATIIGTAPGRLGMYERHAILYLHENGHYSGHGWQPGGPKWRDDTMQRLVKWGFVKREGDAQRMGHYALTDEGRALVVP